MWWSTLQLCFLSHLLEIGSGAGGESVVEEGQPVDITCKPDETGTMLVWFRVLDTSNMEFIASFTNTGVPKVKSSNYESIFGEMKNNKLTLKSFNKARDSGAYSCAALVAGNRLTFGPVTRLVGGKLCFMNSVRWRKGLKTFSHTYMTFSISP